MKSTILYDSLQAPATSFYVTGGTLQANAPSYVERRADHEMFDGLLQGEFCYVLTSRQMGKSSLMVRTATRLRTAGVHVAVLDLTAIGQNLSPEQWYDGLLLRLGRQLRLEDEMEAFWDRNQRIGPSQRFFTALRDVALAGLGARSIEEPSGRSVPSDRVVVFVDELDTVRSLHFSTDEFFAGIRECYNRRTEDPEMSRLTFCLLGVATPSDLIRDTRMTPFNIGRRIDLNDFSPAEAAPLRENLGLSATDAEQVLNRILYWTNGHPYLTQRLCHSVSERNAAAADGKPVRTSAQVDALCHELFLSRQARERDDNLLFVRERILRSEGDVGGLLTLYGEVLGQRKEVANDDANPLISVLRLAGVVRVADGKLALRNRIYSQVFDGEWVRDVMPGAELRRQKTAYRRGIAQATAGGVVLGLLFAAVGALFGFTAAGGKLASLFHVSELAVVVSAVYGGLVVSFGPLRPIQMLLDALGIATQGKQERLKLNALICESGSLYSLAGGVAATTMGLIITLNRVGGDVSFIAQTIAAAATGILAGSVLSGLLFQPLKYRFLAEANSESEETRFGARRWVLWLVLLAVPVVALLLLAVAVVMTS